MNKQSIIMFTAVAALSGCASNGVPGTTEPRAAATAAAVTDRLPAQNLAPGECGLFVFARDEARTFILFAQQGESETGYGKLFDGGEVALTQTAKSGASSEGQYPEQSFQSAREESVKLTLRSAQSFDGGTRYPRGIMERVRKDGWALKTPVAGLSTCLPQ